MLPSRLCQGETLEHLGLTALPTSPQEGQGLDLRSLSLGSLEQLNYTSCVIKETLRLKPPVPGGFRVALKTFTLGVSEKMSPSTK